jgi:hypothetical protein
LATKLVVFPLNPAKPKIHFHHQDTNGKDGERGRKGEGERRKYEVSGVRCQVSVLQSCSLDSLRFTLYALRFYALRLLLRPLRHPLRSLRLKRSRDNRCLLLILMNRGIIFSTLNARRSTLKICFFQSFV